MLRDMIWNLFRQNWQEEGRGRGRGCGAPGIFEQLVGGETMALTSGVEGGQVVLVEVISG